MVSAVISGPRPDALKIEPMDLANMRAQWRALARQREATAAYDALMIVARGEKDDMGGLAA
jgi:hypothetical protein